MSYDIEVYCKGPSAISIADLSRKLPEWHLAVCDDQTDRPITPQGVLIPSTVVAWRRSTSLPEDPLQLLATGVDNALAPFFLNGLVTSCSLSVTAPFSFAEDEHEEISDPTIEEVVASSEALYSLCTTAGRNELALEFQFELALAIAACGHGVVHDPQLSEFHDLTGAA